MTARERAEQLCEKWFEKGMRASWCTEMVDDFASALADAERGVWELAATLVIRSHKSTDSDKWLDLASEMKARAASGVIRQAQAGEEG